MKGLVFPGAEDGGTDADKGGAILQGNAPIAGHPDRELTERREKGLRSRGLKGLRSGGLEGGQAGANRAEQPADPFKIAPDYRFILRVRCHSHQTTESNITIRLPFAHRPHSSIGFWGTSGVRRRFGNPEQGEDFGLREAMLGFLRAQVEFQEDGYW